MLNFSKTRIFIETFFRRKLKLVLWLGILICLSFLILWFLFKNLARPTISEGIVGVYEEWALPDTVLNLVSKGLIKIDQSGKTVPEVAESFEVNSEGTSYTIKLKNNLHWSDASLVKAPDIALSLSSDISIDYPDENTIGIKLNESFSPFLSLLNKPILKKNSHLGLGPYSVEQIKKDNNLVKKIVLMPVSDDNLPRIIIRFYPNEKIARNALKIGEIQTLLGAMDKTELNSHNLSHFNKVSYNQLVTIFYNTKDAILSDENFRLGLSFSAPVIKNEARAKTSIPPTYWAFNDEVKEFLENTEQSKSHLNKVKNGRDSTIVLTATSSLKNVGERVVEAWNRAGIKSVLRVESGIPQNFQALLIVQNIPSDPDQYSLWHSTQEQTNVSKISSPRIDKDLEDGRKSTDLEVRKIRYFDFQRILLDRAPATFLYFPKYNVVYLKKIEGNLKKVLSLQLSNI